MSMNYKRLASLDIPSDSTQVYVTYLNNGVESHVQGTLSDNWGGYITILEGFD